MLRFCVCPSVLYFDYLFCEWIVLGPYHKKVSLRPCLYGEKLARATLPQSQLYRTSIQKKREPGYDESPLSTDCTISVRMLSVARLGPARRVDSLETVYMRKSWLVPRGHPILPTE